MKRDFFVVVISSVRADHYRKLRLDCIRAKRKQSCLVRVPEDMFPTNETSGGLDIDKLAQRYGLCESEQTEGITNVHDLLRDEIANKHNIDPHRIEFVVMNESFAERIGGEDELIDLMLLFPNATPVVV